ncbi:bifunctional phosphoribosylaminoimidazolecarboxamide formyltransferase/IMP cyclohydrolase [Nanchangia anserum]|uniref:Bifunctional purine biosynthesis protein PurH n=1 Tax=Nanchangia anserum TaxID=2692125 RepID=A0A8I0G8R4_9ACTO|nr:bifunctional phosphoribosylaminoimidazolecarboxamide formyltransferase/IMP cyclohydrolase [Nanchangia anserum]MBD3690000.1 bifunctional phosphoribosylaminoimidazolecarboxamide formyltransferase/IMP cyclohydrolase [Nanchangia anserum]QOX82199.1 bifunctional phosphoribosylaminoimidazolecarboxamide formyltransferase/IMP cyclohydrolase [Nanchangia anserum]
MTTVTVPDSGEARVSIRRALVSVYDKTGILDFARALEAAGVEIVSTGSTAARIREAGIAVTPVEDVTGFPECLEGRVKTLHPRIHAGILADRRKAAHCAQLDDLSVAPFDLVVCNLYPFADTVASGADADGCVEQIDIGGPSMVRAAAKNHPSVAVIVDPARYDEAIEALAAGGFTLDQRRRLAAAAFAHTASYDAEISRWFADQLDLEAEAPTHELRYGENPHQSARVIADGSGEGIAHATQLQGKAMSFNNYTDADAALRAAYDHSDPCVAIVKHANPCGIATAADVAAAHRAAHACDPVSAYGGVIACNRPVSVEMARQIRPIFTEVVIAPDYEDGAVEELSGKKNLRILKVTPPTRGGEEIKQISGGQLRQSRDDVNEPGDRASGWTLVAGQPADDALLADLEFAWRSVRSVRSNAILLAKGRATVGVGMGQVNRVDSAKLAVERANTLGSRATGDAAEAGVGGANAADVVADHPEERARGSVAASDAFFPFADGLQVLIDAGVRAVVQPGGSIRDDEVIAAANAAGITMYLTGVRHFCH